MAEIKHLDEAGVNFLIQQEGLRLKPYRDSVGIPTIGVGSTYYANGKRVKMTDPAITKAEAIKLFKTLLKTYERGVWSVTRDDISQSQFNALVSICYNIGVSAFKGSTLLRRVNAYGTEAGIRQAFEMWRKPPELLPRRKREANLYFS